MEKPVSRCTEVKPLGKERIDRKKCFEGNKNLISQDFPLKSPTKKIGKTRYRRESKKILSRKRSFNVITNVSNNGKPKISRKKSLSKLDLSKVRTRVGQIGRVVVKVKKKGKSTRRKPHKIAKEERGKRVYRKVNLVNTNSLLTPRTGKRIIKGKNNTSSIFRPKRFLKRKLNSFERDPDINIIAGTPAFIEEVNTGKQKNRISNRKYSQSHCIRPLFSCQKRRVDVKPVPVLKKGKLHAMKRRIMPRFTQRRTSFILPCEVAKKNVKSAANNHQRPCTRSSVSYNILSWK